VQSRLSLTALFSLLSALLSPLLSCFCVPTIVFSLAAVVLGHIGLVHINRSQGRLSGMGLAIAGLVLGYPLLLISGIMAVPFFSGMREGFNNAAASAGDPAAGRLSAAERKIISDSQGVAQGNSPEAIALADKYSKIMKSLREALFTEEQKRAVSLTDGNFVTYCELRAGKCAFLVHVPSYRNFTDDAKESLAELAWMSAQKAVEGTLKEGDQLGVGLKGTLLYGSVMVGVVPKEGESSDPEDQGTEKDALLPFFEDDEMASEPESAPADAAVPESKPAENPQ
jgi:hypothetical protein